MALNNFNCNHLMPLHFKTLRILVSKLVSKLGDAVALLAGQRTCNSHVVGSSPGWAPLRIVDLDKLLKPVCLCHQAV